MMPPVAYFGGRLRIASQIVELLPKHSHYVEPFFGSGAVLFAKPPTPHETVNDLDGILMTFWQVLRERPNDLARACALTPHARAEYSAAAGAGLDAADELELARQVCIKLTQGRSGRLRRTGWRHYVNPAGSSASMPRYLAGHVDRIAAAAGRLQHVSLEHRPALDLIARYGAEPDVLLYVDPPYLGATRGNDNAYRHELRATADHRDLAAALDAAKSAVVISGYPSELYDRELYAGWDRHEIPATTSQSGMPAQRTEVLWANRPIARCLALFGDPLGAGAIGPEAALMVDSNMNDLGELDRPVGRARPDDQAEQPATGAGVPAVPSVPAQVSPGTARPPGTAQAVPNPLHDHAGDAAA